MNPRMTIVAVALVLLVGLALMLVREPSFDMAALDMGGPWTGETTILAGR